MPVVHTTERMKILLLHRHLNSTNYFADDCLNFSKDDKGKGNLFPVYAMKGYVWAEVWLYGFLSSILHKSDWSDS
jgi:hypothetical protein